MVGEAVYSALQKGEFYEYEFDRCLDNASDVEEDNAPDEIPVLFGKSRGHEMNMSRDSFVELHGGQVTVVCKSETKLEKSLADPRPIPNDRYYLAKWILLLHGVGTLLPWNMFCTAEAYFTEHKFGDVSDESEYKEKFLSYLGIAAFSPTLVFMIISLFTQHRVSHWRAPVCLVFLLLLSLETTVLAIIDTSAWPKQFFIITMATIVVINGACAVYQSDMFGFAAKFPPSYMQFHVTGQGVGGFLSAILNIMSLAVSDSLRTAAILFFSCSLVVIMMCLVSYFVLLKLPITIYYHSNVNQECTTAISYKKVDEPCEKPSPPYLLIAKEIKLQLFNVWSTFFVTLALFPSVLAFVESSAPKPHSQLRETYFTPVCCFLLFATGDACGSFLSGLTQKPGPRYSWIFCIARIILFPLILFCNYRPETRTLPVFFTNDMFFIVFNVCISLSHGYLKSIVMMHGPRCVTDPKHSSTAAAMMALFMVIGIYMGVQTSLIFPWISSLS
ncbi:equilibrative nucleoside transporter 3-like isoform X2 [Anneissia japonica]|nr:equilibrative nucleoside transporter 3-like isoform X2 [Anneissia japonica]